MLQRVLAFIGPISFLYKIGAVAALVAVLWGGWQYHNYKQRQIGRAELVAEQEKADKKTLKEKEARDDKLREDPSRVIDALSAD